MPDKVRVPEPALMIEAALVPLEITPETDPMPW